MSVTKKKTMSKDVFAGISAVYVVAGGFTVDNGSADLSSANIVELPVSENGGVSVNGGTPSTSVFRIHGLNAPWTSRMTPGDAEVSLQIPTYNNTVLDLIYGEDTGDDLQANGASSVVGTTTLIGKSFSFPEKSVYLGLLIINDTEDKALFIKKAKVMASPQFDGEDTPFAVNLSGTIASGTDKDAIAILEPTQGIVTVNGRGSGQALLYSSATLTIKMAFPIETGITPTVSGSVMDCGRTAANKEQMSISNVSVSGSTITCTASIADAPNQLYFIDTVTVTLGGESYTANFKEMASDINTDEQCVLAVVVGDEAFDSAAEISLDPAMPTYSNVVGVIMGRGLENSPANLYFYTQDTSNPPYEVTIPGGANEKVQLNWDAEDFITMVKNGVRFEYGVLDNDGLEYRF